MHSARLSVANYAAQGGLRVSDATSPYTITGLGNGTRYYILVTARNAEAESDAVAGSAVPAAAPADEFNVSVTVRGLQGTLVLNNGHEDLVVMREGSFPFATALPNGTAYTLSVKTQPASQRCTVGAGAQGTIDNAHVFGIEVSCGLPLYELRVAVAGLQGQGLVLQNNGKDDLSVPASGQYRFSSLVANGHPYGVSVRTQPTLTNGLVERCFVVNSSGIIQQADVTNVGVECVVPPQQAYAMGGSVNGLKGSVVLRNDREDLVLRKSGAFRFALPLAAGKHYDVSIVQQPSAQHCTLSNAVGDVTNQDVGNIVVACQDALILDANALSRSVELTWNGNDALSYSVYVSTNAACDLANYTTCPDAQLQRGVSSPYRVNGLDNDRIYYFWLEAQYPGVDLLRSPMARARPGVLRPDGAVLDIEVSADGTTYIAGEFKRFVPPPYWGSAVLNARTGKFDSAFTIEGDIYAVVADGAGGWFVGGSFARVNGVERQNLAHILADDNLDPGFDVKVDGPIYALLLHGKRLYVGGAFAKVNDEDRPKLAAIDRENDNAVMPWRVTLDGEVTALAADGDRIYAGGRFHSIEGVNHAPVAAFDLSGTLLPWNPEITFSGTLTESQVFALAAGAGRVYVAGLFDRVAGQLADSLAAFAANGAANPVWTFDDGAEARLRMGTALLESTSLYVAGYYQYTTLLRAIDSATGQTQITFARPMAVCRRCCAATTHCTWEATLIRSRD